MLKNTSPPSPQGGDGLGGDVFFSTRYVAQYRSGAYPFDLLATHETGHALGLDHVGDGRPAVMNPTLKSSWGRRLEDADVGAIQALYGAGRGEVVPLPREAAPADPGLHPAIGGNPFDGWKGKVLRKDDTDLTGDGRRDAAFVAVGVGGNTHVKVFDGAKGVELASYFAFDGFGGEVSVAAGEVTGEGLADLIFAAAGHVKAFDGATGEQRQSFFAYDGYRGDVALDASDRHVVTGVPTPFGLHRKLFRGGEEVASFYVPLGA